MRDDWRIIITNIWNSKTGRQKFLNARSTNSIKEVALEGREERTCCLHCAIEALSKTRKIWESIASCISTMTPPWRSLIAGSISTCWFPFSQTWSTIGDELVEFAITPTVSEIKITKKTPKKMQKKNHQFHDLDDDLGPDQSIKKKKKY